MTAAPRCLVADPLSEEGLKILREAPFETVVQTDLSPSAFAEVVREFDGVIIRSKTRITAEVLARRGRLRAVVRAGVGVDNVDCEAAKRHGVVVLNTPGGSTNAVAELALAMLLALSRDLGAVDRSMKEGRWEKKGLEGTEVAGKTLGIAGLGRIGLALARKAQGIGMRTIGFDPITPEEVARRNGVEKMEPDAVFAASDYLSLHLPLQPDTRHLINAETIARMKKGVRILNCARGGVVDEAALLAALERGHVAGAGLDVFEEEPPVDLSLVRHPRVIATPHIGAATKEAQASVAREAAEVMRDFLTAGTIRNRVA
jgi:D-3-phosphoglycerate dehydrogenase